MKRGSSPRPVPVPVRSLGRFLGAAILFLRLSNPAANSTSWGDVTSNSRRITLVPVSAKCSLMSLPPVHMYPQLLYRNGAEEARPRGAPSRVTARTRLDEMRLDMRRVYGCVYVELEASGLCPTAEREVLAEHFIADHLVLEPPERRFAWNSLKDITVD